MKRSVLIPIAAAVTAAAIAGVLSRPYLWPSRETKHAHVMEQARAEPAAAIYYRDPDGNRMEFQVDCMTPAQANAYMASEAFAANAAGIEFDPERLLAQYESGVTSDVLLRFPDGAPGPIPEAHGLS